jgi:hypothetical protein
MFNIFMLNICGAAISAADRCASVIHDLNYTLSFVYRDRGFEPHLREGYMRSFCVCIVLWW